MSVQSAWESSVVGSLYHSLIDALKPSSDSRSQRLLQISAGRLTTATWASSIVTVVQSVARWIRASVFVRSFIVGTDSGSITTNLRLTHTVGPILAFLTLTVGQLTSAWRGARIRSLVSGLHNSLCESPIRTLSVPVAGVLLAELIVAFVTGTLTRETATARVLVIILAVLGTGINVSWDQCTESVTYRALVAAIAPSDQPETDDSTAQRD